MPVSTGVWIPYPTAEQPVNIYDLPEWDSIMIGNMVLPIEGIPRYTRKLGIDKKNGAGTDYYSITSKGIKPSEIHITLKLWVDWNTKKNYLDMYRQLIPQLVPNRLNNRFSIPIYHPALSPFGVTSAVFTEAPTPQHVGNLIFHAELVAVDGRDAKQGTAKKEFQKFANVTIVGRTGPQNVAGTNSTLTQNTTQSIPQAGFVSAGDAQKGQTDVVKLWNKSVNTPAGRSTVP